jgi:hypothetical protein
MQTRRGFFGGMVTTFGAFALIGCVDEATPDWTGIVAPEPVALQPGMQYANVMPTHVPSVRLVSLPVSQ